MCNVPFPVQIVSVDSYMSAPISGLDVNFSEFRGASVYQVPVIRLFGSIPTGEKVCVHIHNVFPYIYIPYDNTESEELNEFMVRIASSIDKSVNISLNQTKANVQHVYKITLVSGIPMYGFHRKEHQFLKIHFYNPRIVRRVCSLLENEETLGKLYQPHESHLSFILQFMIDYNLHGMSNAVFDTLKFRVDSKFNNKPIDAESFLAPSVEKSTVCQLEIDVSADSITNRHHVDNESLFLNPGIASLWEDERQRCRLNNDTSLLDNYLSLTTPIAVKPTKTHEIFKQALKERLAVAQSLNTSETRSNQSVYASETQSSLNLPSASSNDTFTPSSDSFSLNVTLTQDSVDLSVTLDDEAVRFLEILDELNENARQEETEVDSILSQHSKMEEDDEEEDLTQPLDLDSTLQSEEVDVRVPQLDGNTDWEDINNNVAGKVRKLPDMPDLQPIEGNPNTPYLQVVVARIGFKLEQKKLLQLKNATQMPCDKRPTLQAPKEKSIKKRIRKPYIRKVKVLTRKEMRRKCFLEVAVKRQIEIMNLLENGQSPKFRRCTKFEYFMRTFGFIPKSPPYHHKIHITVALPTNETFLYTYHNSMYARVTKLLHVPANCDPSSLLDVDFASNSNIFLNSSIYLNDSSGNDVLGLRNEDDDFVGDLGRKNKMRCKALKLVSLDGAMDESEEEMETLETKKKRKYTPLPITIESATKTSSEYRENRGATRTPSFREILKAKRKLKFNATREESSVQIAEQYDKEQHYQPIEGSSKDVSIFLSQKSSLIYEPLNKPPTRQEIQENVKVLQQFQKPFYSNPEDISNAVEVGHNTLKILTKSSTAQRRQFESCEDSLNRHRKTVLQQDLMGDIKLTKTTLLNIKQSFCCNRDSVLMPLIRPPTFSEVIKWIEEKKAKHNAAITEKTKKKMRVILPSSPSRSDEDEGDVSMDLSILSSPKEELTSQSSQGSASSQILNKTKDILNSNKLLNHSSLENSCQLSGPSNKSLVPQENMGDVRLSVVHQNLTLFIMEVHTRTRGDFKPNPDYDPICAIFYTVHHDINATYCNKTKTTGIIAVNSLQKHRRANLLDSSITGTDITYTSTEQNLITEFLKLIAEWDPDILAGYEIEMLSWGYLVDRSKVLGVDLIPLLSRTKDVPRHRDEEDMKFAGRILLDVWRLMRHEMALQCYTFESVVYHILQKRVPLYTFKELTFWWDHPTNLHRHITVGFYLQRVLFILQLFEQLDLIGRTSELARLFGIQFYEVLSRGSQFRVESMMLRLAKPLNFIPVSPSVQQRANMRAPEFLPLILEPESKMYVDPVIVLDFQSLYPSVMIAYNYCFTTCLGRVEHLGKREAFEFGATQLKVSPTLLTHLMKKDLINFSPCGVAFVKKCVRDGILPRMLREILETRLMVKESMKKVGGNRVLKKVLHNRQLGLKLIANVTYGYTAANFSGRMAAVEIADSVVSKGRETLQRAIAMVDGNEEWNARVVYGDTDSLFVMVPGRSRKEAFEIGKKIANAVTEDNPKPMKLKLEKVYQPCILQTKKRYVGFMYESAEQTEAVFEAKGIETVRRDGCPAVSKMLEKCLRILFETKDVSLVKKYVLRQFHKIVAGRINLQDLIFAKEYRGAKGYRPGACVPAFELAKRWSTIDKRAEPRSSERVPYVIVNGAPGVPLIRLVHSPKELLGESTLRPNALYYITRVIIPPINRCMSLIGVDLNCWFAQMPRKVVQQLNSGSPVKKNTISQYFTATVCVRCGVFSERGLCVNCCKKPQDTTVFLMEKIRLWEENFHNALLICKSCGGESASSKCVSLNCAVLYRRNQTNRDFQQTLYIRELLKTNEFG